MSIFEPARSPWPSRALSVLRIATALFFMMNGTMKLFGWPPPPPPAVMPEFELLSQMGIAGMLETFGGAALLLGLFTRPVAFILAGEMAAAYFIGHFPMAVLPVTNNGQPAVLYCFVFLYFVFSGGGVWSVDAMLARSRGAAGRG